MTYRIFAILSLLVVIVGSIMLAREPGQESAPSAVQRSGSDEGYSARNATLVETGADGEPIYTLNAATIRQEPDHRQVDLTEVHMSFRDASGHPWTASADRGELGRDSDVVILSRNVLLAGTPAGTSGPAQVLTEQLRYDTRTEVARTAEPVTLIWPGCRLEAVGLMADLKHHRVQLESSVHGICAQ